LEVKCGPLHFRFSGVLDEGGSVARSAAIRVRFWVAGLLIGHGISSIRKDGGMEGRAICDQWLVVTIAL
jgi:hypothetical protein